MASILVIVVICFVVAAKLMTFDANLIQIAVNLIQREPVAIPWGTSENRAMFRLHSVALIVRVKLSRSRAETT